MHDITTYVIATKRGRRVCAGRAKHAVDLDLAVARTGPHEVGAGRAGDPWAPRGPEVGEHAPDLIATKYSSCDERCGLKRWVWVKTLSARLRKEIHRHAYNGLRRRPERPPVAGLRIHAQNVSDGVAKDGDKTRRQELEIYSVCIFMQSVEQHTKINTVFQA